MLPDGAVAHLKVRSGHSDSPALRLSISRQLGCADLRVRGTSPSAVLLVRALSDPLPGRVSSHPTALGIDPQWERALRQRLEALRAGAARPRDGHVQSDADAILFSDEAELIACLALHLATHSGPSPWWRKALAPYLQCTALPELLGARAELLPAVFHTLARWRGEDRVAACLSDDNARDLVIALGRNAGAVLTLEPPGTVLLPGAQSATTTQPPTGSADAPRPPTPARHGASRDLHVPPWRDVWQPASTPALAPVQQLLVGFALALQRAPALARSMRFARAAQQWLHHECTAPAPAADDRGARAALPSPAPAHGIAASAPLAAVPTRSRSEASPPGRQVSESAPRTDGDGIPDSPRDTPLPHEQRPHNGREAPHSARVPQSRRAPLLHTGREALHSARWGRAPLLHLPEEPPSPTTPEQLDLSSRWSEEGMLTELGGVLYLVNLLEHLDLPECFELDCRLASTLGVFGTLEAIARALFHPLPVELEEDPLWTLLAALDQRDPGEAPRADGLTSEVLHLPSGWPVADDSEPRTVRWASDGGRLCVWCDEGYPIAEVPLAGNARRHALDELSRYPGATLRAGLEQGVWHDRPLDDLPQLHALAWPPPLLRWLAFVTPYLRWRLARALGHTRTSTFDPVEEIARLPARIYATDTHIDVVASLQSIRTPLRLAGLDRSPGWVKRLQRVVLFHFE